MLQNSSSVYPSLTCLESLQTRLQKTRDRKVAVAVTVWLRLPSVMQASQEGSWLNENKCNDSLRKKTIQNIKQHTSKLFFCFSKRPKFENASLDSKETQGVHAVAVAVWAASLDMSVMQAGERGWNMKTCFKISSVYPSPPSLNKVQSRLDSEET